MVSGFLSIKIKSATKSLTMNATNTLASANSAQFLNKRKYRDVMLSELTPDEIFI